MVFPRDDRWRWVLWGMLAALAAVVALYAVLTVRRGSVDLLGAVVVLGGAGAFAVVAAWFVPKRMTLDDTHLGWDYLLRPSVRLPLERVRVIRGGRTRRAVVATTDGRIRGVLSLPGFAAFADEVGRRSPTTRVDLPPDADRREVPTLRLLGLVAGFAVLAVAAQLALEPLVGEDVAQVGGPALAGAMLLAARALIARRRARREP